MHQVSSPKDSLQQIVIRNESYCEGRSNWKEQIPWTPPLSLPLYKTTFTLTGWQLLSLYNCFSLNVAVALPTASLVFINSLNWLWISSNWGLILLSLAAFACDFTIKGNISNLNPTVTATIDHTHGRSKYVWTSSRVCWTRPIGDVPPSPRLARVGSPRELTASAASLRSSVPDVMVSADCSWMKGFDSVVVFSCNISPKRE